MVKHHPERRVCLLVHSEFLACTQLPIDRFIKYSSLAFIAYFTSHLSVQLVFFIRYNQGNML
jgi:hypothetical protein